MSLLSLGSSRTLPEPLTTQCKGFSANMTGRHFYGQRHSETVSFQALAGLEVVI